MATIKKVSAIKNSPKHLLGIQNLSVQEAKNILAEAETFIKLNRSSSKKIDVLRNIIIELDLKNVIVERIDAQDISNEYDFILNRAVSSTENILSISRNKIKTNSFNKIQNGIICLKGGNLENETVKLKIFEIFNLNKIFSEPFFETKKILYLISVICFPILRN